MNELRVSVQPPRVEELVLRRFGWRLNALPEGALVASEAVAGIELELDALLDGTGELTKIRLRLDRSEFVNIATGGLTLLDAADAGASYETEGGETQ